MTDNKFAIRINIINVLTRNNSQRYRNEIIWEKR